MGENSYAALSKYVDLLLDAICVVDKEDRFVFVSAGCKRIFGYTPEEMIGRLMIELVFPEDRAKTLQIANEIMDGQHQLNFENRYLHKDGQIIHILWSARWSEDDQVRVAVARDITQIKCAEARQVALYAISEAAYVDEDLLSLCQRIHQIIADLMPASNFAIALYDEESGEVSFPYEVDEQGLMPSSQKLDSSALCTKVIRSGQALLLTPAATADSPSWLGVPLKSHQGIMGALMVQHDSKHAGYTEKDRELLAFVSTQVAAVIERKQMLIRLKHTALYDPLTQLPNRILFSDRIQLALAKARRKQGYLALLYLDLDKFKYVNDTFGHAVGDTLLTSTAQRLLGCVRGSDTVARYGGDEFVILLENSDKSEAELVADKICIALAQPFDLAGQKMHTPPSIGIALFPLHGDDERQLLLRADEALYLAKRKGGSQFQMSSE